jgi:hypothetical protein
MQSRRRVFPFAVSLAEAALPHTAKDSIYLYTRPDGHQASGARGIRDISVALDGVCREVRKICVRC